MTAGDNKPLPVDDKRILKRLAKPLARPLSEAVEIHSPPEQQTTSGATPRVVRGPGNRILCGFVSTVVRLARRMLVEKSAGQQVARQRGAPASHTWRGLTAVPGQVAAVGTTGAGLAHSSAPETRSNKDLITGSWRKCPDSVRALLKNLGMVFRNHLRGSPSWQ